MTFNGESYGHIYLSAYGWEGPGVALRKGAINKPLAIPPKKNLGGLGKDRDEAFPFWDHLFTAASKAITIKVSNDDHDTSDSEGISKLTDSEPLSLKRTTTGIISNRRPITETPASTPASASRTTTPNPEAGHASRLSLIAAAKREAAKRGLYSKFFKGPVLGPDDDPIVENTTGTISTPVPVPTTTLSAESDISVPTPAQKRIAGDDPVGLAETVKKGKKRKFEDREETKEERRERKRLKKERRAAKVAEKVRKAEKTREKSDSSVESDQKVRKGRGKEVRLIADEERGISPTPQEALQRKRKRKRKSEDGASNSQVTKATQKKSMSESSAIYAEISHIPLRSASTTKKKKGKRKDINS